MCCPNNCNQRMCVPPIAVSPACEAVVAQLTPNASYIPQCLSSGDYRPLQCSGDTGERLCWCANTRTGIPYTSTFNDHFPDCERTCSAIYYSNVCVYIHIQPTFSPRIVIHRYTDVYWHFTHRCILVFYPFLIYVHDIGCIYGGSMYAPGQSYTAEDGCNTWYASAHVYVYMKQI